MAKRELRYDNYYYSYIEGSSKVNLSMALTNITKDGILHTEGDTGYPANDGGEGYSQNIVTQLMMSLHFDANDEIPLSQVFEYRSFDQTNPWEGEEMSKAKAFISERFSGHGEKVNKNELEECFK